MKALDLAGTSPDPDELLDAMILIRGLERALADARAQGRFEGPVHVSVGQEAVAVGTGAARVPGDVITAPHRGHHHALAFGLEPERIVAEIVGHRSGYAAGLGGSMHIMDPASGFLGTNGVVGDSAGLAVGAALALHRDGDSVAIGVVGDGAMGTGVVYEAMNLARLWRLPVVFLCENNGYAEMTPTSVHLSSSPTGRAEAFGLEVARVDGQSVSRVRDAVAEAIASARGGSPAFVEVMCRRRGGHYVGDVEHYRTDTEDEEEWRARHCPIRQLGTELGKDPDALDAAEQNYQKAATALIDQLLEAVPETAV